MTTDRSRRQVLPAVRVGCDASCVPDAQLGAPAATEAIVFTDIEGSTRLFRDLGPRYDRLLARHHELMRQAIAAHGGVEVSTEGDAFFVLFDRPAAALCACIEAQLLLAREAWPSDGVVRVRMGIHWGEVRPGGDNVVGMGVHQAARVAPAAHGGQILVSGAVAGMFAGALPDQVGLLDLGPFHLRDFDETQHLFQVLHPDLERLFPPARATVAIVHNLTRARTSFVGRAKELEEIGKAIDVAPLVTIVGPGGVGKTRVAREVGLGLAAQFPNGVWFVPLARADASSDIAEVVRVAMGLEAEPHRTAADVVAARLSSGESLLILDNCEHVLDACAELAEALLDASESVRVLATSREHLGVMGEAVVRLAALDVPGDADDPADAAAVQLFASRATHANAGFVLDAATAPTAAAITRRLDGMPLAIELAAARLATMTLGQLEQALGDSLATLDAGRRRGDERQRTLRATIDWSYQLLGRADQQLFATLGVFRGGFEAEAARSVAGPAAEGGLQRLVGASLVELDGSAEPPRYRMLETVRAFAADQMNAPGAQADHAHYFGALAATLHDGDEVDGVQGFDRDYANFLAALEFVATEGSAVEHGALLSNIGSYWNRRGLNHVARAEYERYLARPDADPGHAAGAWMGLGHLAYTEDELSLAHEHFARALELARQAGDADREAWASLALARGLPSSTKEDENRQAALINRAIELGDDRTRAAAETTQALLELRRGNPARARDHAEKALAFERASGRARGTHDALMMLGRAVFDQGDFDAAGRFYDEALELARLLGDYKMAQAALLNLSATALHRGDGRSARIHSEQALGVSKSPTTVYNASSYLGTVAAWQGDNERAVQCFKQALQVAQEHELETDRLDLLRRMAQSAAWVGDLVAARSWAGEALELALASGDRAAEAEALERVARVEGIVGDHAAEARWYEQAVQVAETVDDPELQSRVACNFGDALESAGEYERARDWYTHALAIGGETLKQSDATYLLNVGGVTALAGDLAGGIVVLREAVAVARETGDTRSEFIVQSHLGLLASQLGDRDDAVALTADALALLDRTDSTHERVILRAAAVAAILDDLHAVAATLLGGADSSRRGRGERNVPDAALYGDVTRACRQALSDVDFTAALERGLLMSAVETRDLAHTTFKALVASADASGAE